MAEEHPVILGDEVHTAPGRRTRSHFCEHAAGVGHGLQGMPADHEVELGLGKRQGQSVAVLKADARSVEWSGGRFGRRGGRRAAKILDDRASGLRFRQSRSRLQKPSLLHPLVLRRQHLRGKTPERFASVLIA
jgi:hypothetical protein